MPTEAQLIAQVSSIATMNAFKNASLPQDDMVDYNLAILAMLKAIEEKATASTITYAGAALGRRGAATSLSVVDAQKRIVTATFLRPATTPTYVSGQMVGAVSGSAALTLTNLFGQAVIGTSATIRKITLLRTGASALAAGNYRIAVGTAIGFATGADAAAFAPTPANATQIQAIQTLNMTSLAPTVQFGSISIEDSIISAAASADGGAAIINLGSVVAVASESFTLSFHIQD